MERETAIGNKFPTEQVSDFKSESVIPLSKEKDITILDENQPKGVESATIKEYFDNVREIGKTIKEFDGISENVRSNDLNKPRDFTKSNNITGKINVIHKLLTNLPTWKQMGVEVIDSGEEITFKRGNVKVIMPSIEVLIFGAKSVYQMFATFDR